MKLLPIVNHSLSYNRAIDGLRGVAILLVLFFHLFPNYFSFGYVGVDIFFILSGFLITQIISTKMQNKSFSFLEFYRNRIRRIFPAMIIVLLATFVTGYLFLFPSELTELAKHIKSSSLFMQNFTLIKEAGYWDTASTLKPLLHFWSLSIEEQFYIFWPIIIWIIYRFNLNILTSLGVIFLALLVFPQFSSIDPFYHSLSRFWELSLGGLAFVISARYKNINISKFYNYIIALFFIAIIMGYDNHTYSLTKTIFITLATAFLIALLSKNPNHKIFSNKILLFFGLISFPLYLWHYMLIGYANIFGYDGLEAKFILAFISIVLSYLTYIFIEIGARKQNSYKFMIFLLAIVIVIVFGATYIKKSKGLNQREHIKNIAGTNFNRAPTKDSNATTIVEKIVGPNANISHMRANTENLKEPFFMVIGDSHAYGSYDALSNELKKKGYKTFCISNNSMPPLIATRYKIDKKTENKNKTILKIIENIKPKKVIWISRGEIYATGEKFTLNSKTKEGENYKIVHFFENMRKTFEYFDKKNIMLYFILENPEMGFAPEDCLKRPFFNSSIRQECSIPKNMYLKRQEEFMHNVNKIASQYKNIKIIDTKNIFCDTNLCYAKRNGKLLYFDDNHLNLVGTKLQASEIVKQIFINDK